MYLQNILSFLCFCVQNCVLSASKIPSSQGRHEQSAGREGNVMWMPVLSALKLNRCLRESVLCCFCHAWTKWALVIPSPTTLKAEWFLPKLTLVLLASHHDMLSNNRQFSGSILIIFMNTANNSLQSLKYLCKPVPLPTNCVPRDKL